MSTAYLTIVSAIVLLALSACSDIETRPAAVDTFAAGNYHYYSWRSAPLVNTGNSRDPMYRLDPIVRKAIDKSLQSKGYIMDEAKAEFTVDYIFAEGVRDGVVGTEATNLSTHPGVVPDRTLDQASIDNAYALGSLKETRNIGIQLNDAKHKKEVWRVIITKLVEDANTSDASSLRKSINAAVEKGMRPLPPAKSASLIQ